MSGNVPPLAPPPSPVTAETPPFFTPTNNPLCFIFPDDTERSRALSSLAGRVKPWNISSSDVYAMHTILSSAHSNLEGYASAQYAAWRELEGQVVALAESHPQEAFALLKSFPFTHEGQELCACTKTLTISNSNIKWDILSPQVWDILNFFRHLEELNLSGVSLKTLPSSILPSFQNLHTLRVTHSNMTWLPHWLSNCRALHTLDLRFNQLDSLPNVHLMPNLKNLYMYGNIPLLRSLSLRAGHPTTGVHRLDGLPLIEEQGGLPPFNHKEHLAVWVQARDYLEALAEANFPQLLPFPIENTQIPLCLYHKTSPLSPALMQLDVLDLGLDEQKTNLLILQYNIQAMDHNRFRQPLIMTNMINSVPQPSGIVNAESSPSSTRWEQCK